MHDTWLTVGFQTQATGQTWAASFPTLLRRLLTWVSQRINFDSEARRHVSKEISKSPLIEELGSVEHTHEDFNLAFTYTPLNSTVCPTTQMKNNEN